MPLSAPTERKTFDSERTSLFFVITFQSEADRGSNFCLIVIVESGRNARRELGKKYEKLLVPKRISLSFSFREREKRYQRTRGPTQSMLHHRFIQIRLLEIYVYTSSSVRVPFHSLSFLALSLLRAQKEERTRLKNERGKVRTIHTHRRRRARARGKPNQITKIVFLSFTFDSE